MPSALKVTLSALLAAVVASGATLIYSGHVDLPFVGKAFGKDVPSKAAAPAPVTAPLFSNLDPFTVILNENGRQRIFYTAITVKIGDVASRKELEDYKPEVRDRILKVLSSQDPRVIQTQAGRSNLSADISKVLSVPFDPQLAGPAVESVLFTQYLVQ